MRRTLSEVQLKWLLVIVLLANVMFFTFDLIEDVHESLGWAHMLPEGGTALGSLALVFILFFRLRDSHAESVRLHSRIGELEVESNSWRKRTSQLMNGLAAAIDEQMESWGLSVAEKEVAFLLLKGLSNKEIAEVRTTSEQTVKQQSSSIYRKSGLASRAELAAFFLEDLFAPREGDLPGSEDNTSVQPAK